MIMLTMKDVVIIAAVLLLEPPVLVGGTWLVLKIRDSLKEEESWKIRYWYL